MILVAILIAGLTFRQVTKFQLALAELGKLMAAAENNQHKPIVYQNSITPPWLTNMWLWIAGIGLGLIIFFSYQEGLEGLLRGVFIFFIGFFISGGISRALSFPRFETYSDIALHTLINREADYRRDGDIARADAAKHFVWLLSLLLGKK